LEGKPTALISGTWLRSDLSPVEQLRAAAVRAFPTGKALKTIDLNGGRTEVWERLAKAAGVTDKAFAAAIAEILGLLPADNLEPDTGVLSRIPTALVRQEMLLPLREEAGLLVLATAFPFQGAGINRARFASGKSLDLRVTPPAELDEAIHRAYMKETDRLSGRVSSSMNIQSEADGQPEFSSATEKLARGMLLKAIAMRASDMHLKPYLRGSEIRFRVDGILRRIALLPDGVGARIIRYFKANGDMDPTMHHLPQDGRMSLTANERQYDLRISVLPATGGESLVIRFLEQGRTYSLSNTGLSPAALQAIRRMLSNANGVVLMTGPTGSGKSSTLYSMVGEINRVGINITTIENPVEYRVLGITQVEVNEKAGLTFPSVIRSCMRQDPDVLLVGEIRDQETAEIAIQAAVTGHLVLSTLHTNDAVTSVARLVGLGIQPVALSDALVGVIAQRLVRRLCPQCRVPIPEDTLPTDEALFKSLSNISPSFRAGGCEACGNTGYQGRLPVVEIFEVTPEISQMIAAGSLRAEQLKLEDHGQHRTLAGSASRLIVSGETTVQEAVRVIGRDFWPGLAKEYGTTAPANPPMVKEEAVDSSAVIIISSDEDYINEVEQVLVKNSLALYSCTTAAQANQLLRENEEIFFAIVDLHSQPDEDNVEWVRDARVELYWSYLPAILLLPADHPDLQDKLVADGAISEMRTKPVKPSFLLERIKAYSMGNAV
jgi:type II secretory ATPase GspE/PulE/Tfp pilus assembly ATPase PilB-like protein